MFTFGDRPVPDVKTRNLGFAGFRIHGPINRPDYFDEIGVFLGASYFRAVAKDQTYGLSARGLSLNTADPKGEEFPIFRSFWVERPAKGANSIVVHALLDSESAAAAYRFTIRPGETTVYDVEAALFPRVQIEQIGLATLTSMFFFAPNDRGGVDDFRPAVHDSDGLAIQNGRGEQIWRPLNNPADLQVSAFVDNNPRGFGLMQRQRDFRAYEDLEARYEKPPERLGRADRRLGRRRGAARRDPDHHRDQRQHRRVLAPARADPREERIRLHLPHPLGRADAQAAAARAGGRDAHRRRRRRSARLFVLDFAGENLKGVAAGRHQGDGDVRQGQGAQRRVAAQSGDRRHALSASSSHPGAKSRSSCARSFSAARSRCRKSGSIDGRREARARRAAAAGRARTCPPEAPLEMPVQSLRDGRARRRRLPIAPGRSRRAARSCSARRWRSARSPPTRCTWCSRSAG